MPTRRFKVEGTVTIQFEAELSEDELDCMTDGFEDAVESFIEGDPVEFLNDHRAITYREDSVEIESCEEMEPDWGDELKKVVTKANKKVLCEMVDSLPNAAKEAIVKAITGKGDDDDDDEDED